MDINIRSSIPSLLEQLESHGIVDNFRILAGKKSGTRKGPLYTDSDLFKWMEGAAHSLQDTPNPGLAQQLDDLTSLLASAQRKDGYLNTYYTLEQPQARWKDFLWGHELYCLGHLIQAGIALQRATGQERLLSIAVRFADLVVADFGPGKKTAFTGHPEAEMAYIELYRTTGNPAYLDFAQYLLEATKEGHGVRPRDITYAFSIIPYSSRKAVEGHAVRCMYANAGAADLFAETGDPKLGDALRRLWHDLVIGKLYLTGGAGSRETGEAIGESFELPNEQAYTETCAAIGSFMWNWRMLLLTGEAQYADLMEQTLYNGILAGVSLSGREYFYRNPLEARGNFSRKDWYTTTCCPPNIQRTLASLPGYFYSQEGDGLWIHQFGPSQVTWRDRQGVRKVLRQQTDYPWEHEIRFQLELDKGAEFPLYIRVPGWSNGAEITVGDEVAEVFPPGKYAGLKRPWNHGDSIRVRLLGPPAALRSNPRVRENHGRIAVRWGPLVYCLEQPEMPEGKSVFNLSLLTSKLSFEPRFDAGLLGGVAALDSEGTLMEPGWESLPLYFPASPQAQQPSNRVRVRLIPYFAWANRGPSEMLVWLPVTAVD